MTVRLRASQVACGVAALAVVMAIATLGLHWANRAVPTEGLPTQLWPGTVLQTLTWALAGVLIVSKRPHNRFGWVFCAASLAVAVTALGRGWHFSDRRVLRPGQAGGTSAAAAVPR